MKKTFLLTVLFSLAAPSIGVIPSEQAHAASRSVKNVIRTSLIGSLIGTGVGLVSWPISENSRAPFVGASTGLYLGILFGLATVMDPDFQRVGYQPVSDDPKERAGFPTFSSSIPPRNSPAIYTQIAQFEF